MGGIISTKPSVPAQSTCAEAPGLVQTLSRVGMLSQAPQNHGSELSLPPELSGLRVIFSQDGFFSQDGLPFLATPFLLF